MTQPADRGIIERWRREPTAPMTLALCSALARRGEASPGSLDLASVLEIGAAAARQHGQNVSILVAVGRMYLAAGALERALNILVAAVKRGAQGMAYQLLGEILLRMGDARRSARMFEHLVHTGGADSDTVGWYTRALEYTTLQDETGAGAVARMIETTLRSAEPHPAPDPAKEDARHMPPPVQSAADARTRGLSAMEDEPTEVVSMTDLLSDLERRRAARDGASAQEAVDFDLDRDELAPDELVTHDLPAPAPPAAAPAPPAAAPPTPAAAAPPPPPEAPREAPAVGGGPVSVTSGKILPVALGGEDAAAVPARQPPRSIAPAPMIAAAGRARSRSPLPGLAIGAGVVVALLAAMVGLRVGPFAAVTLPWGSGTPEAAPAAPDVAPGAPATQAPVEPSAPAVAATGSPPPVAPAASPASTESARARDVQTAPSATAKKGAAAGPRAKPSGKPTADAPPPVPLWPGDPEAR